MADQPTDFQILRKGAGWTQAEASEKLKVNYTTVRSWEKGRRGCPDDVLREMLAAAWQEHKRLPRELERIGREIDERA